MIHGFFFCVKDVNSSNIRTTLLSVHLSDDFTSFCLCHCLRSYFITFPGLLFVD